MSDRFTYTWGAGSDLIGSDVNVDAANTQRVSASIPDNTADQPLNVDFVAAKLQSIFISVSRDCTLEVNSSSAPDQTIALKAGIPFSWVRGSGVPYPFVDVAGAAIAVTNLFLTVPDATPDVPCVINLRAALDL